METLTAFFVVLVLLGVAVIGLQVLFYLAVLSAVVAYKVTSLIWDAVASLFDTKKGEDK